MWFVKFRDACNDINVAVPSFLMLYKTIKTLNTYISSYFWCGVTTGPLLDTWLIWTWYKVSNIYEDCLIVFTYLSEQTVALPVIWDAITPMQRPYNVHVSIRTLLALSFGSLTSFHNGHSALYSHTHILESEKSGLPKATCVRCLWQGTQSIFYRFKHQLLECVQYYV